MAWNQTLEKRVEDKTTELRQAQDMLLRSRSLSALGELGAGVAHEINNPLTGALGIVQLLLADLPAGHPAMPLLQDLETRGAAHPQDRAEHAAARRSARAARTPRPSTWRASSTTPSSCAGRSELAGAGIEVVRRYEAAPPVRGQRHPAQEAFIQLIQNARARCRCVGHRGGKLTLEIKAIENKLVRVIVSDTGTGISARTCRGSSIRSSRPRRRRPHGRRGWGCRSSTASSRTTAAPSRSRARPGSGTKFLHHVPRRRGTGPSRMTRPASHHSRTIVVALIAVGVVVAGHARVAPAVRGARHPAALARRPDRGARDPNAPPGRRMRTFRGHVRHRQGRGRTAAVTAGRRSSRATSSRAPTSSAPPRRRARCCGWRPEREIELRAGVEIRFDAWGAGGPAAGAQAAAADAPQAGRGASVDLRRGKVLARVGAAGALAINSRRQRHHQRRPGPLRRAGRRARPCRGRDHRGHHALRGRRQVRHAGRGHRVARAQAGGPPGRSRAHLRRRVPQRRLARPSIATASTRRSRAARRRLRSSRCARPAVWRRPPSAPTGSSRSTCRSSIGKTPIEVEAEDLVGPTKQATTTLTRRPPPPPALTPEVTDLWKKPADK